MYRISGQRAVACGHCSQVLSEKDAISCHPPIVKVSISLCYNCYLNELAIKLKSVTNYTRAVWEV